VRQRRGSGTSIRSASLRTPFEDNRDGPAIVSEDEDSRDSYGGALQRTNKKLGGTRDTSRSDVPDSKGGSEILESHPFGSAQSVRDESVHGSVGDPAHRILKGGTMKQKKAIMLHCGDSSRPNTQILAMPGPCTPLQKGAHQLTRITTEMRMVLLPDTRCQAVASLQSNLIHTLMAHQVALPGPSMKHRRLDQLMALRSCNSVVRNQRGWTTMAEHHLGRGHHSKGVRPPPAVTWLDKFWQGFSHHRKKNKAAEPLSRLRPSVMDPLGIARNPCLLTSDPTRFPRWLIAQRAYLVTENAAMMWLGCLVLFGEIHRIANLAASSETALIDSRPQPHRGQQRPLWWDSSIEAAALGAQALGVRVHCFGERGGRKEL